MRDSLSQIDIEDYFDNLLCDCYANGATVLHLDPQPPYVGINARIGFCLEPIAIVPEEFGSKIIEFLRHYEKEFRESSPDSRMNGSVIYPAGDSSFVLDIVSLKTNNGMESLTIHIALESSIE